VLLFDPSYSLLLILQYIMNRLFELASPRVPRGRKEGSPLSDYTEVERTTEAGAGQSVRSSRSARSQSPDANAPKRASDRLRERKVYRSPGRTLEEEEGDRGGIDSDLDEQLTDFDESDVDSLAGVEGDVDPSTLVRLTEDACRVPCNVKVGDGTIVRSVCGRSADDCKRHQGKRAQGGRQSIGFYARVVGPGARVHGKLGHIFMSESQMETRLMRDRSEMGEHLRTQNDEADPHEEAEIEALRRLQGLRQDAEPSRSPPKNVAFGGEYARAFPTPPSLPNPVSLPAQMRPDDPRRLETPFQGLSVREKAKGKTGGGNVWAGMIDSDDVRQAVEGIVRALAFVNDHYWTLVRTFESTEECLAWANQSPERKVPSPPPLHQERPRRSRVVAGRPKYAEDGATDYPRPSKTDDRYSEPHRASRPSERKQKPNKERRRKKKRERRRRHRSPSSSSGSSTSSSSRSDGSYYRGRTNSRRREVSSDSGSGSDKRPHRRGHHAKGQRVNTAGADVSKGLKNYVFDKDLTGRDIDKAMGPEGLSTKDTDQLYDLAVDVASLPGMYISRQDTLVHEEQMTATLLASVTNSGKNPLHDSMWKSRSRHGLREAKDEASFFELVQEVSKAEKHAFENQEICLRSLLSKRHYDSRSVDNFIQHGLLLRITRDTFQWYKDLLNSCREQQYRHQGAWEGGPAESMLSHHSKAMYGIRQYAPSKKIMILRMYTYLRDTKAKGFYDNSMSEALWDKMASMSKTIREAGSQPSANEKAASTLCSHCKSKAIHTIFHVENGKRNCPLKDHGELIARRMAGVVVKKHVDDPEADLQGLLAQVVATWR
jgi:hypothetical protein